MKLSYSSLASCRGDYDLLGVASGGRAKAKESGILSFWASQVGLMNDRGIEQNGIVVPPE